MLPGAPSVSARPWVGCIDPVTRASPFDFQRFPGTGIRGLEFHTGRLGPQEMEADSRPTATRVNAVRAFAAGRSAVEGGSLRQGIWDARVLHPERYRSLSWVEEFFLVAWSADSNHHSACAFLALSRTPSSRDNSLATRGRAHPRNRRTPPTCRRRSFTMKQASVSSTVHGGAKRCGPLSRVVNRAGWRSTGRRIGRPTSSNFPHRDCRSTDRGRPPIDHYGRRSRGSPRCGSQHRTGDSLSRHWPA